MRYSKFAAKGDDDRESGSMKRALITGAAGQDGTYLTELLLAKGYEVWGVVGPEPGDYLQWAAEQGEHLHPCEADLCDSASIDRLIAEVVPDEVYNFAGISSVAASWERPALVFDINGTGVARLLEALRCHAPNARLCQASSAEIFGHPAESPQTEATPIHPVTPYGAAKAAAHFLVQNARDGWGIYACSAILYNHESPRRPSSFVTAKIAEGAVRAKLGLARELRMGNLDSARDWGWAGDYVDAMWRMLQAEAPGDYVIATGTTRTVRDFCKMAFSHAGLDWEEYVVVDPQFFRPIDLEAPVGNADKAERLLGWAPTMPFDDMVGVMVDAAMERLAKEGE